MTRTHLSFRERIQTVCEVAVLALMIVVIVVAFGVPWLLSGFKPKSGLLP